jgi:hypothetical protein
MKFEDERDNHVIAEVICKICKCKYRITNKHYNPDYCELCEYKLDNYKKGKIIKKSHRVDNPFKKY